MVSRRLLTQAVLCGKVGAIFSDASNLSISGSTKQTIADAPTQLTTGFYSGGLPSLSRLATGTLKNYAPLINRILKEYGGVYIDLPDSIYVDCIEVPSNAMLRGISSSRSRLKQLAGADTPVVRIADPTAAQVRIEGLCIDGNGANQRHPTIGLEMICNASGSEIASLSELKIQDPRHVVSDLFILNTLGPGIVHMGKGANQFSNIWVYNTGEEGIIIDGFDSVWSNVDVGATGGSGIRLGPSCANNRFTGLKIWYTGQRKLDSSGIHLDHAFRNNFSAVEAQNCNGKGIYCLGASYNNFSSVSIEGPSNGIRALFDGVVFDGASYSNFSGLISERNKIDAGTLNNAVVIGGNRTCKALNISVAVDGANSDVKFSPGQTIETISIMINGEFIKKMAPDASR